MTNDVEKLQAALTAAQKYLEDTGAGVIYSRPPMIDAFEAAGIEITHPNSNKAKYENKMQVFVDSGWNHGKDIFIDSISFGESSWTDVIRDMVELYNEHILSYHRDDINSKLKLEYLEFGETEGDDFRKKIREEAAQRRKEQREITT